MSEFDRLEEFGARWARMRMSDADPRDARCQLHLQRVCGVCEHFAGQLRPAPGAPALAPCSALEINVAPTGNAMRCHRWTRKLERNQA